MTGAAARALAVRLAEHGYLTSPVGRDPAVFKLTGLPGDPDVEVTAEDNRPTAGHRTGSSLAEAAAVIARLPVPGRLATRAVGDAATAPLDDIEIEWRYLVLPGQLVGVEQVAEALLAHLSVLADWSGRRDAALAAGAGEAGRG